MSEKQFEESPYTRDELCKPIHGNLIDVNDAETCNLLCIKCNASAVFANGHCECNFVEDSNKGAECIQNIQREIQAVELNMLSDDLTDEERKVRSVLKYRRRLRPESASYVNPMQGVDPSILGAMKPPFIYPPTGIYDPTYPVSSISHPHGLPHALFRAVTFPAHLLHQMLHPHIYHHYPLQHHGIIRRTNDNSKTDQTAGESCENNDGSNTSNVPTTKSNTDKPIEQNVLGLHDPSQHRRAYITDTLYQPIQYQNFPYPYASYNPLMNILHSIPNDYYLQPIPQYSQDISLDPQTSASNPQSVCKNNKNTGQKNEAFSDKTTYSTGVEKSDDSIKNNISNEEKKTEKIENNQS
ncbi:PREDICTED: uncharacterized protein LOC108776528 [Cyphomyrmex costatus]|uniref:uncharacterized protein LOC108776528 n=1 Tax=Cyphomyrmex costatus TaxID=456900 RepID=UPI000852403E|nr:PREDICTED: uncharacterized protein LOC108776528 [Cyphomyrmex costatus]